MSSDQKNRQADSGSWEEGFTLLETLAAVVIMGIGLGLTLWGGHRIMERVERIRETNIFLGELTLFEEVFRESVSRVVRPWWNPGICLEPGEQTLVLDYLDGVKGSELTVSLDDAGLVLTEKNENSILFPALNRGDFFLIGGKDAPIGAGIVFYFADGEYRINGTFGGIPLYTGEAND